MLTSGPLRRRRKLSLTPLIDVIFLLLLFFMLSSTFSKFSEVKLAHGTAQGTSAGKPDVVISVTDRVLQLNGSVVETAELGAALETLKENGARQVLVMVTQEALSQDFVTVVQVTSKAGLSVSVARQGP